MAQGDRLRRQPFSANQIQVSFEASNARWIVDFKTAMPAEGETIEAFEERELARYGAQLDNYADLASELSWEREVPIKKALYYPGIQHLSIVNA